MLDLFSLCCRLVVAYVHLAENLTVIVIVIIPRVDAHDISAVDPLVESTVYGARIVAVEAFSLSHPDVVGSSKLLGQHLEQVLRSLGSRSWHRRRIVVGVINHLSEELQLAPQVVAQRPPGKSPQSASPTGIR